MAKPGIPEEALKLLRERIAKKIYDWGYENQYFKGSSKVWNFVDPAEPEADGARDLANYAIEVFGELAIPLIEKRAREETIANIEKEVDELMTLADLMLGRGKDARGIFIPEHKWEILKEVMK